MVRRRFASRGYSMPKINERQAEVIEGAEILENSVERLPASGSARATYRSPSSPAPRGNCARCSNPRCCRAWGNPQADGGSSAVPCT